MAIRKMGTLPYIINSRVKFSVGKHWETADPVKTRNCRPPVRAAKPGIVIPKLQFGLGASAGC